MKIISVDAETNGLWGEAFAIAAVVRENGVQVAGFMGMCPIKGEVNEFVETMVLPELNKVPVTHNDYEDLLKNFVEFYKLHRDDSTCITHVGLPVEAKLFIDAHEKEYLGDWEAPFPLVDISAIPEIGTSVDYYNKKHEIEVPVYDGGAHNPLYDCTAAALAYEHWLANR